MSKQYIHETINNKDKTGQLPTEHLKLNYVFIYPRALE